MHRQDCSCRSQGYCNQARRVLICSRKIKTIVVEEIIEGRHEFERGLPDDQCWSKNSSATAGTALTIEIDTETWTAKGIDKSPSSIVLVDKQIWEDHLKEVVVWAKAEVPKLK